MGIPGALALTYSLLPLSFFSMRNSTDRVGYLLLRLLVTIFIQVSCSLFRFLSKPRAVAVSIASFRILLIIVPRYRHARCFLG